MNWSTNSATESLASQRQADPHHTPTPSTRTSQPVRVGKRLAVVSGKEMEVFTMSLGDETIELLPLRNWGQLDSYKWRVRGKIPGTPAGLEITPDHIKLLGETVAQSDPQGCSKLEKLFADWLAMEWETLEMAKRKAQQKAQSIAQPAAPASPDQNVMRFRVEVDKEEQVHIHSIRGKEMLATIGLNPLGFQSLVSQGFMRKPHGLKVGALHDWVELDGALFSFEKGHNDAARLEQALNDHYLPPATFGNDKAVTIYSNAASSTGFDIQFPAKSAGVIENRRRPLAEDSLELLQDQEHCGLLHKSVVIKLSRPTLIFKLKTPEGGERYFDASSENLVRVAADDGDEKFIDLSRPVNYLHLSSVELTAVFNHPSINRHAQNAGQTRPTPALTRPSSPTVVNPITASSPATTAPQAPAARAPIGSPSQPALHKAEPVALPQIQPNLWLKPLLLGKVLRFEWFIALLYEQFAVWAHNSQDGVLDGEHCWFISMGEADDLDDPDFIGIYMRDRECLGFLSAKWRVEFSKAKLSIVTPTTTLQAPGVTLLATGIDKDQRLVPIVSNGYEKGLGAADPELKQVLAGLIEHGCVLVSLQQAIHSPEPLEVVWTVPAMQLDANDPKAVELRPPLVAARKENSV